MALLRTRFAAESHRYEMMKGLSLLVLGGICNSTGKRWRGSFGLLVWRWRSLDMKSSPVWNFIAKSKQILNNVPPVAHSRPRIHLWKLYGVHWGKDWNYPQFFLVGNFWGCLWNPLMETFMQSTLWKLYMEEKCGWYPYSTTHYVTQYLGFV